MRTKQKGFTIIEVLIVLAIAGLILLIVFLAVPALQRNSRNTQKKNDVAGVLGIINEFANNHNGTLPGVMCINGNTITVANGSCAAQVDPASTVTTGSFTTVTATISALPSPIPASASLTNLVVYSNAACNTAGTDLAAGTSNRAVAAFYQVEPSVDQCSQS